MRFVASTHLSFCRTIQSFGKVSRAHSNVVSQLLTRISFVVIERQRWPAALKFHGAVRSTAAL
jgi:hypothetical protein